MADSKVAREMLCFTIETAAVGREGRICETAGAGYARAMPVPLPFGSVSIRWIQVCAVESNVRNIFGDCNCRLPDALAEEFRGRGKESHVRNIFGECDCRLLDALSGGFRGRGKEIHVRNIIVYCNCRLLDAL